ncbi:MAG: hypothetical protein D8M58_16215 [Calditrichaeota bacterium]|nr:MAG: hypothetical protein DWQ03_07945 [Calditrichota bacterium]MBL1206951.1 hypothetical protein [Calditrichota bacterium]NOG46778.1 hypothetical protein [Calditrichota bacterium]
MEYSVLIIFAFGILIWIYLDKNKNSTKDYTKSELKTLKVRTDFLHDPDKKPSIVQVESYLEPKILPLFMYISEQFEDLGAPALFWRGKENGWVLGLKEDETCGSVILAKENLVGQTSRKVFNTEGFDSNIDFIKFELKNENDIAEFYEQIKYNFMSNL